MYNGETSSKIAGQMPIHKEGSVRVHVPGANGPRSPRTKCWRNWLARGKWQRQVLHTKCTLSGESQPLGGLEAAIVRPGLGAGIGAFPLRDASWEAWGRVGRWRLRAYHLVVVNNDCQWEGPLRQQGKDKR